MPSSTGDDASAREMFPGGVPNGTIDRSGSAASGTLHLCRNTR